VPSLLQMPGKAVHKRSTPPAPVPVVQRTRLKSSDNLWLETPGILLLRMLFV
jgi:hypothetical protein